MPVTLTIKQVPDRLAEGLRRRAAANRRSQQQELILLLENAVDGDVTSPAVREPARAVYRTETVEKGGAPRKRRAPAGQQRTGKLDIETLWLRARKLGAAMPSESSTIVRADRDAGHR